MKKTIAISNLLMVIFTAVSFQNCGQGFHLNEARVNELVFNTADEELPPEEQMHSDPAPSRTSEDSPRQVPAGSIFNLSAVIRNSETGAGISGAWVRVSAANYNRTLLADDGGFVNFGSLPAGTYGIDVAASGYNQGGAGVILETDKRLLISLVRSDAQAESTRTSGRYKVNGDGLCYLDTHDSGPDQCIPAPSSEEVAGSTDTASEDTRDVSDRVQRAPSESTQSAPTGRYKSDGNGGCYFDANDSGPNQC
ncbi:MAG: carboxypeptidase-like regulatory domain-containing protein [Bdellovibrionia bacterium]